MPRRIHRGGNSEDFQLMFLGDVDTGGDGSAVLDGYALIWNEDQEKFLPADPVVATGLTSDIVGALNAAASPTAVNAFVTVNTASDGYIETTKTFRLPDTVSATVGVLNVGASRFLHTYADSGTFGQNMFIGIGAGNFTMGAGGGGTTASRNVGIGFAALAALTTGERNTFVGWSAGENNTTGFHNTGVGDQALRANTTGDQNAAFGVSALLSNTDGNKNMAIGFSALHDNTIGYENVGIGANALLECVDGTSNVAIGSDTLTNEATPAGNTAVGAQVLQVATGGTVWNTGVGYQALLSQTAANFNTAVGAFALKSNTSGGSNTAVGLQALYNATTATDNVALGKQAGYYETGSNKLFIDNQTRASEAAGRTDALIYGIFDGTVANQKLTFNCGYMGFFGTAAVAKPTGVAVSAAGIHAALVTLGLIAA